MGELIIGSGSALPDEILTNSFFLDRNPFYHFDADGNIREFPDNPGKYLSTRLTEEGIVKRTGIIQRRRCVRGETAQDLAEKAAREALDDANLSASDLGGIVVASLSQGAQTPSIASTVHGRLGAPVNCGAYDVGVACAGYVIALNNAAQNIRQGLGPQLAIGVETPSKWIDYNSQYPDINWTLFGDGAGAAILYGTDDERGVRAFKYGCNASEGRDRAISVDPSGQLRMADGGRVFSDAAQYMAATAEELLEETGWTEDDVRLLIPHQANLRIIKQVARRAGFPMRKVFVNIQDYGNMSAATTAVGLHEARQGLRDGYNLDRGDKALMVGFGAGFVWAGLALQM